MRLNPVAFIRVKFARRARYRDVPVLAAVLHHLIPPHPLLPG
jgi:hypothetical protein